jgi:hypothetical protein
MAAVAAGAAPPPDIATRPCYGRRVFDRTAFHTAFASAGRRLGDGAEAGRIDLLVAAAAGLEAAALVELVDECWRTGDNDERAAVLRGLVRLPDPARFVPLAVSACRTNVVPVFEAIACENTFPARHFVEPSWNQMVIKALFLGVAIERIIGLGERVTPELERMARAYASERAAGGRPVSDDTTRLATWTARRPR